MNGCFDDLPCPSADVREAFYQYVESLRLHRLPEQQMLNCNTNEFYATHNYLKANPWFSYTMLPYWRNTLTSNKLITNDSYEPYVHLISLATRNRVSDNCSSDNVTLIKYVNTHNLPSIFDTLHSYVSAPVDVDNSLSHEYKLVLWNVDVLMHSSHGEFMLSLLLFGIANILHQHYERNTNSEQSSSTSCETKRKRHVVIELCVMSDRRGQRVADLIHHYLETQCHIAVARTNASALTEGANNVHNDAKRNDNTEEELEEEEHQEEQAEEWKVKFVNDYREWIDEVKSNVVDLHEQLCDELNSPGSLLLGINKKQVILLLLPEVKTLRSAVIHELSDAYTSIPLHVHEERELCYNDVSSLHLEHPLVLICSLQWLYAQTLLAPMTTVFSYIHISAIVSGDNDDNEDVSEKWTRDVEAMVLILCNQKSLSYTSSAVIFDELNSVAESTTISEPLNYMSYTTHALEWQLLQINLLLSITRRFRLRSRRANKLPHMVMHRHHFISQRAWHELSYTLLSMHRAGVILANNELIEYNINDEELSEVSFSLTPFGRLASTTMKMERTALERASVQLSIVDKKYLIWMFLFRQAKEEAMQEVKSWHTFNDWVDKAVQVFYEGINITFAGTESKLSHTFHHLCACFAQVGFAHCTGHTFMSSSHTSLVQSPLSSSQSLEDTSNNELHKRESVHGCNRVSNTKSALSLSQPNRVYELIVTPHGFRTRSCDDKTNSTNSVPLHSNMCRGWEVPSTPLLQHSTSVSQPQIWSLPTSSLYCELLSEMKLASNIIQCPLIYSQPIIVLHSLLHISFHNTCIFAEMSSDIVQLPLPDLLLKSPVFNMLLQESSLSLSSSHEQDESANRESWVDAYTSFVRAIPSANEMYTMLSLRNTPYVESCEHGSYKRERERSENELQSIISAERAAVKGNNSGNAKTFSGIQPRTPLEEEAITQFLKLVERVGREKAERAFRGKKGFAFIDSKHDLHPFYLYSLKKNK